jgi:hypothetical protein
MAYVVVKDEYIKQLANTVRNRLDSEDTLSLVNVFSYDDPALPEKISKGDHSIEEYICRVPAMIGDFARVTLQVTNNKSIAGDFKISYVDCYQDGNCYKRNREVSVCSNGITNGQLQKLSSTVLSGTLVWITPLNNKKFDPQYCVVGLTNPDITSTYISGYISGDTDIAVSFVN